MEDTARPHWPVTTFRSSPLRTLMIAAGGAALTVVSGLIALRYLSNVPQGSFVQFMGYVGVIFFAPLTVLWLRRAFVSGRVLSIGPQGIRDTQLSEAWIPWSAILSLRATEIHGQAFVALDLDPAVAKDLPLTWLARIGRAGNRAAGLSESYIGMQGLRGSFEDLIAALEDGLSRYEAEASSPKTTPS